LSLILLFLLNSHFIIAIRVDFHLHEQQLVIFNKCGMLMNMWT
jgi:hypothetical protein